MKIAIYNLTATTKLGGLETFSWEMARELAGRGFEVEILAGHGELRGRQAPGLEVHTFPFRPRERFPDLGSRFRKLAERLSLARHARGRLAGEGYAAVVVVKPYDIPAALWARRRSGCRVCYFSGGGEFFPGYAFLVRRLDHFCACSAFDAQDIAAHCGVRPAVNHYGVDTDNFRPLEPDPELARRWGIEPGDQVVASAVRLVAFKGITYGLEALALARERLPRLRYLLAGSGPEEPRLRRRIRELGLEGVVRLVGQLSHSRLAAFYSLAQVAIFPSVQEALGIAVAEAMSCGLAVVASRGGGMPEMAVPGAGITVPPRDPQALAAALVGLFQEPARLEELGRAARRRVLEHFTWSACADRLLAGLGLPLRP